MAEMNPHGRIFMSSNGDEHSRNPNRNTVANEHIPRNQSDDEQSGRVADDLARSMGSMSIHNSHERRAASFFPATQVFKGHLLFLKAKAILKNTIMEFRPQRLRPQRFSAQRFSAQRLNTWRQ
mmetsp:Transcript_25763/g.42303  ORF Transcript_25763/g.42303 Transcript_25763/m.42303 type:complete len:123 (+) Transcript_25763:150-518(+)